MEIRDFVAYRGFSGNGLWQRDEKPGLARHAECSSVVGLGTQMDRTFLRIWVYGEGERPEPTRSVDATIEGEPIELSDDRKSGRCPSKSNRRTTLTPKRFFKPLTQTMPRIFHVLLCDKSDEFVKIGKMCADPPRIFLTCRLLSPKTTSTSIGLLQSRK